ncbi:MAG TPA: hypothetical protein DEO95_11910 [Ruminococcaceae bacterium]|nr:hypothetical protein [Oscillospiraceae bacterium]
MAKKQCKAILTEKAVLRRFFQSFGKEVKDGGMTFVIFCDLSGGCMKKISIKDLTSAKDNGTLYVD